MQQAERGMQELLDSVDTMIVIPNEKLLAVAKDAGFFESFRIADDVLRQGVQGISDIITIPGIINRDFADVKTTMAGMGYAVMGTAVRSGTNRAIEAAQAAMASPLLEAGAIDGAKGILINISGSSSLKLSEVNEASTLIQNSAHEDANIIFGAVLDERMGDEVKITVIATGFRHGEATVTRSVDAEKRTRMFSGAVMETPVPVPVEARPSKPRFMSEVESESAPAPATRAAAASPAPEKSDWASSTRNADFGETVFGAGAPIVASVPEVAGSFLDALSPETGHSASDRVATRQALFAEDEAHNEHLDIPAFMRQGGN